MYRNFSSKSVRTEKYVLLLYALNSIIPLQRDEGLNMIFPRIKAKKDTTHNVSCKLYIQPTQSLTSNIAATGAHVRQRETSPRKTRI